MTNKPKTNIKDFFNTGDLYKLLDNLVILLKRSFKIDYGFIYFLDKSDENFKIVKVFGLSHTSLSSFKIRKSVTFINICRENDYIELNDRFLSIFPEFERLKLLKFGRIYSLKVNSKIYGGLVISNNPAVKYRELLSYLKEYNPNLCLLIENLLYEDLLKRIKWEKQIELEVGRKLSGTLDIYHALNYMIDKIKEVIEYNAAGIFLIQEKRNKIEYKVLRGYDRKYIDKVHLKLGTGLVGWCAKTGKGVIVGDTGNNQKYIEARKKTKSQIVVPLYVGGIVKGVLNLESDKANYFTREHYDYLESIANITGIFIENFRLNYEFIKTKEIEKDLKIANDIQKALLPTKIPRIMRYRLARFFKPSKSIGGDLYDIVQFSKNKLGIAIGDISGKGISGAILMASFYSIFKSQVSEYESPNQFAHYLNNEFRKVVEVGNYSTFFYGVLDYNTNSFYYTNAGHNPPLVVKKNGEHKFLKEGGIVLGYLKDMDYELGNINLDVGDIIVFYTDGITEAKNKTDEEFGEERLRETVYKNREKDPVMLKNIIRNELDRFRSASNDQDDMTLLILKREK
ncbi:GAF domain-containing SpoIIE family protein phosphatase [candidate division KSB1 bacterium]